MNQVMTCLNLNTPCAVTGKSGMPFFNPAMQALLDSPLALELFQAQEEKARESRQFFSVQNQCPYGPKQTLQPYLFDFYPQFDCDCVDDAPDDVEFECIGTVCHARPFAFGSTQECVDGEAPNLATEFKIEHPIMASPPRGSPQSVITYADSNTVLGFPVWQRSDRAPLDYGLNSASSTGQTRFAP